MEDSPSPGYDDRLWNRERQEGRKEGRWSKADEKYLLVTGKEIKREGRGERKRMREGGGGREAATEGFRGQ